MQSSSIFTSNPVDIIKIQLKTPTIIAEVCPMRILFAASENAWGGFLGLIRSELPEYHFEASGSFQVKTLEGFDVLIPTM
ncbi:MAG: hypothetical protein EHJ94_00500, partial [Deltaproteobacteria bacterium]